MMMKSMLCMINGLVVTDFAIYLRYFADFFELSEKLTFERNLWSENKEKKNTQTNGQC